MPSNDWREQLKARVEAAFQEPQVPTLAQYEQDAITYWEDYSTANNYDASSYEKKRLLRDRFSSEIIPQNIDEVLPDPPDEVLNPSGFKRWQKMRDAYLNRSINELNKIAPEPKKPPGSIIDPLTGFAKGVNVTAQTIANLFGTESEAAQFFGRNVDILESNLSPAVKNRALRLQEQKQGASWIEKAGMEFKRYLTTPEGLGEGVGQIATFLVPGGAIRAVAGVPSASAALTGLGVAVGAGAVKGNIADTIKQATTEELMQDQMFVELLKKVPEDQARATLGEIRSSYGEAYGKIAIGALAGIADRFLGAGRAVADIGKTTGGLVAAKRFGEEVIKEPIQEFGEQYLGNLGAAAGGADIDPLRGTAEAVGGALAMGGMGGTAAAGVTLLGDRNVPGPTPGPTPGLSPISQEAIDYALQGAPTAPILRTNIERNLRAAFQANNLSELAQEQSPQGRAASRLLELVNKNVAPEVTPLTLPDTDLPNEDKEYANYLESLGFFSGDDYLRAKNNVYDIPDWDTTFADTTTLSSAQPTGETGISPSDIAPDANRSATTRGSDIGPDSGSGQFTTTGDTGRGTPTIQANGTDTTTAADTITASAEGREGIGAPEQPSPRPDTTNADINASPASREAKGDGEINFSKRQLIPQVKVKQVADSIIRSWANPPNVVVIQSMQDVKVPEAVRSEDAKQITNGAAAAKGFYYKGKVYLVTDGLSNERDVVETLFHEALGHYGLRSVFGDSLNPILNQIVRSRRDQVIKKAKDVGIDASTNQGLRDAAEEILAEMAQENPKLEFVQRAVAIIKTWLRKNIPIFKNLKLSDDEIIRNFILPASEWVKRGEMASNSSSAIAFNRAKNDNIKKNNIQQNIKNKMLEAYLDDLPSREKRISDLKNNYGFFWIKYSAKEIKEQFGSDVDDLPEDIAEILQDSDSVVETREGDNENSQYHKPEDMPEDKFWNEAIIQEFGRQPKDFDDILNGLKNSKMSAVSEAAQVLAESEGFKVGLDHISENGTRYYKLTNGNGSEINLRISDHAKQSAVGHATKGKSNIHINLAPVDKIYETDDFYSMVDKLRKASNTVNSDILFLRRPTMLATEEQINIDGVQRHRTNSNGKPIASNDQELRNFWQWFGNSKVVDNDGRPLVVYHGTGNLENIDSFKPELTGIGNDQYGSGFYFTSDSDEASNYTTKTVNSLPKLGGDLSPGIVPVYLSIQKPLIIDGDNLDYAPINITKIQAEKIISLAPNIMDSDMSPVSNWHDISSGVKQWMISDVAKNYTGKSLISIENYFFKKNATAFREALNKATGYDGIIRRFDNEKKHYIAWFPEQIKSAIGNRVDFDPNNPNILFSRRPTTLAEKEQILKTGKMPEDKFSLLDLNDKIATLFADQSRPFDVWLRSLPDPLLAAQMSYGKDLAPNRKGDFERLVKQRFGDRIADGIKAVVRATGMDYQSAVESVGNWMSARYALVKNQDFLRQDQMAVNDLNTYLQNVTQAQIQLQNAINSTQAQTQLQNAMQAQAQLQNAMQAQVQFQNTTQAQTQLQNSRKAQTQLQNAINTINATKTLALFPNIITPAQAQLKNAINDMQTNNIQMINFLRDELAKAQKKLADRTLDITSNIIVDPTVTKFRVGVAGGYNNATANKMIADSEARIGKPLLDRASAPVYEMLQWKLQQDIANGKVTKEVADKFLNSPIYVPLTGDPLVDETDTDIFSTGSVNQGKDKRAVGRASSLAQNGIDAAFEQVEKSANYYAWLPFKDALTNAYDAAIADSISLGMSASQARQDVFEKYGISRTGENAIVRPSDNVIIVRKNGTSFVYNINNEAAMNALRSINKEQVPTVLKPIAYTTSIFSRLATVFMPGFALVNAPRDVWEKSENIRTRKIVGYENLDMDQIARRMLAIAANPKTIAAIAPVVSETTPLQSFIKVSPTNQDSALVKEFMEAGGTSTMSEYLARDSASLAKQFKNNNNVSEKVLKAISAWNNSFELVSSFSAYKALREAGVDINAAAATALNLMNFKKSGTLMGPIRAFYMFAQPTATSAQQLAMTLSTQKGRRRFTAYVIAGMALYAMLRSGEDDDKTGVNRMDELSNYTLERNIPIPLGGDDKYKDYGKLPIGFGLPQLSWSFAVNLIKMINGSQGAAETFGELSKSFAKTVAPVAPAESSIAKQPAVWLTQTLSPQITKPLVNIAIDRGPFGSPLTAARFSKDDIPKADQGRRNTPEEYKDIARELGKIFGIDIYPEQVRELSNYLIGPFNEMKKIMIENPAKEKREITPISPIIDRWVNRQEDEQLKQKLYFRYREDMNEAIVKKQLDPSYLTQYEKSMAELGEKVKKFEMSSRGKLSAMSRAKNKGEVNAANRFNEEADKIKTATENLVFSRMKIINATNSN